MREAVIVASSRTPLAKSFRGSFNLTRPDDLAALCIKDLLKKVPQLDRRRDRGRRSRLRVSRRARRASTWRATSRCWPGLPVTDRRHDDQPLLLVGPAGDRVRRASDHERGHRRRHRRRLRIDHHAAERLQQEEPLQSVADGTPARDLHADGHHRRGRRRALQGQPRRAGRATPCCRSSAPPPRRRRGSSRTRSSR